MNKVNKTKLLIVDDEPEIVDTLKNFFFQKGFEARGVLCAEEALKSIGKKVPDLVFLDLRLPKMDGARLAGIIRKDYPNIKIVVVSAYAQQNQHLVTNGLSDAIFSKPVRLQELYQKAVEICPRRKTEENISRLNINLVLLWVKTRILLKILDLLSYSKGEN